MTITEILEELHDEIEAQNLSPIKALVYDDEDMIKFALRYLMSNLGHAFEEA